MKETFAWEGYVELARRLIDDQCAPDLQEARLRTATSRSYYGVFCKARDLIVGRGIRIPRIDTHKFVRTWCQESEDRAHKRIAKNLRRLWLDRKEADYNRSVQFSIERATTAYYLSIRTLASLRKLEAQ